MEIVAGINQKHQNAFFAILEFMEYSSPEQISFGVTDDGDEFSENEIYNNTNAITTGNISKLDLTSPLSGELFEWKRLSSHNGPESLRSKTLSLCSSIYIPENPNLNGILVWNGNLPIFYAKMQMIPNIPGKVLRTPSDFPSDGQNSVAMIIGNLAVANLFGFQESINSTSSLSY